jgi:hypothetical protein
METPTTSATATNTTSSAGASARPAHPIRRAGLSVGAALFIVETIHGVVSANPLPLPVTAIFFLVAIGGLLIAGYLAARGSGKVSSGALAGLLAGALLGLGYAIGTTIAALTDFAALRAVYVNAAITAHVAYSDQLTIIGTIITVVLSFLVSLGAGAACGAIGGLAGRRRSQRA